MKTRNFLYIGILTLTACKTVLAPNPTPRIEFEAAEAYPEGIAYDSVRSVYYVSSARLGNIGKVTPNGVYSVLHMDTTLKSSYGLKIHPDGKRLFACISDANYSKYTNPSTRKKMARLISIDLENGRKLSDIDLSGLIPGNHFANDLTFDSQGNAYVTDSFAHAIYKVTPDGQASVFARNKMFETMGVGLNGIAFYPEGFLLVDNSSTGQIYKVELANPSNVQKVKIDQFFMGADGLLAQGSNKLLAVVNGGNDKIFELETRDNWASASLSGTTMVADRFTYPATATQNMNGIWIMNARFNELPDSNSVPSSKFAIQKAVLKPIPKK